MAAFNYIKAQMSCPNCRRSVKMKFQTHIASDFDGDATGRFMERDYHLGDEMAWFDRSHDDFDCWMTWGAPTQGPVYEYCHATCDACGSELYGRVQFDDLRPTQVSEVGLAEDWPTDHAAPETKYPPVLLSDDTKS